jgi:PAS domain S-box-containing protein
VNPRPLLTVIAVVTAFVFLLDLWTSAALIGSILFTIPLALCALQSSKRVLWLVAAVAALLTMTAEWWGFARIDLPNPAVSTINRLLLVASLLTLAVFIHFRINQRQRLALDKETIERERQSLRSQNDRLEGTVVAAAHDFDILAQTEDRYRGLLEAAPDGMVVVDDRGEIILLNARAEKHFGYRRDELIRQSVTTIIPQGFAARLIADETRTATEALAQQIGEGIELIGLRKDGSKFPIEIMLSPLENADGVLVTAAIRDITKRKLAEHELRLSEERFRLLVSNARDYAILMLDPDGIVVSWNAGAERIKGYQAQEIIGHHFACFYLPEAIRAAIPAFELREAAKNERYETEGWRVRKDGSRFFANVVITALRDEHGGLRGFGKITHDITERKVAQDQLLKTVEELKRSNEELVQFANVASHDLQEPLRMVASYTQLIARRYEGRLDSDADEFITYAVDGCNRMQALIEDLLIYSRVGANSKTPRKMSSEASLKEALANLRVSIEESGAVVTNDALPSIVMDGPQLASVFQNLVGNAIKYRGERSPRVHISAAQKEANEWIFSVQDNGLGIEAQYFDRIFVLFQRLHGRQEFKGTGIGLAICKKIVERWGGRIWVESQLEKGSQFCFSLPKGDGKE